jgi:hypothetical protein
MKQAIIVVILLLALLGHLDCLGLAEEMQV